MIIVPEGDIAYQADRSKTITYGKEYFDRYKSYEGTELARELNAARCALTLTYCETILDVGIGAGTFIKQFPGTAYGYDVNPHGQQWLKERDLFAEPANCPPIDGITMWDSFEHMPSPWEILECVPSRGYAIMSLPIFDQVKDLAELQKNKHTKPMEHLWNFTDSGLLRFMLNYGFSLVRRSDHETRCGREGIGAYVFRRS